MASNYEAICEENRRRYGTEGAQKAGELAAELYDNRTHFIFELLQNAEDALGRRGKWDGPRRVTFTLNTSRVMLSHYGKPFDEADVRSICDIKESTKDELSIGRFGIGFKSVYSVTDFPEIHSGEEDFAIENYVFPKQLPRSARAADETQIILPLKPEDSRAVSDITACFRRLDPSTLLFLRHINEINWSVEGGPSGFYLRNHPEPLGSNVYRITVVGQESGQPEVDQNWLVFRRDVFSGEKKTGQVEIAFLLDAVKDSPGRWTVRPLTKSPLVVFFPTVVESHLGFLVQGPYRTTPSRDNILPDNQWNQYLVKETSSLLVDAMRWMRDNRMLDAATLRSLPLDREKFPEGSMFAPMFDAVRQAFQKEMLLPTFDGRYVTAQQAKLARTQELRELFSSEQVAALFDMPFAAWLSSDITEDKAPEIRQYLMRELSVTEVTPDRIVSRLTPSFLEAQTDEWIASLYKFLNSQPALLGRLKNLPLVRLRDGRHVVALANGKPQAFLPSEVETGFPTVREAVCANQEARAFLISLGITDPDLVDDVVLNVLHKYHSDPVEVDDEQYAKDIDRILAAFNTDSNKQREKLVKALQETRFVRVVDMGNGTRYMAKPGNVYIATDRLKLLFDGVPGVMIVDDKCACLRGEDVLRLLEACGATSYLRPLKSSHTKSSEELLELRREAGHEETSGVKDEVVDWQLQGLDELINLLPKLSVEQRVERAQLLWESLGDLEERKGSGIFKGWYKWSHYGSYKREFNAAFVERLNKMAWVPDTSGNLHPPGLITFDSLGWKQNPFLLTKIQFKPPIIDQLAKEAGFEPAALDMLRKLRLTTVADLASRLGITDLPPEDNQSTTFEPKADEPSEDVYDVVKDLYGEDMPDITPDTHDPDGGDGLSTGARDGDQGRTGTENLRDGSQGNGGGQGGLGGHGTPGDKGSGKGGWQGKRTPGHAGGRSFISYVGTHPNDEDPDPDGLSRKEREQIEKQAIELIIRLEPELRRTEENNPGFDLYEIDSSGKQIRWIEVKSMTGTLKDRPVGLSRTQFEWAREKGSAYWLYVVERANDPKQARVLRIQNPYGHARTFTFDHGWSEIARTDPPH